MVILFKEVTILGDTYSKSLDRKDRIINSATRSFFIRIDGSLNRSMEQIKGLLPKIKDPHPYYAQCQVKDYKVKNTDSPHDYIAEVNYQTVEEEDEEEETDVEYPWDAPAVITISSDTSQTAVAELAYTKWPFTTIDQSPHEVVDSPKEEADFPAFPILNEPFNEKFSSVPEEPLACRSLDISFNIKGYKAGGNRKYHNRGLIEALLVEYFTVNNVNVSLFGYSFDKYCGYISDVTVSDKYFKTKRGKVHAYYEVKIKVLYNPNTWVRRILNMSFNTIKWDENEDGGEGGKQMKTHIHVLDGVKGILEKVNEPQLIHPATGEVIGLFSDGTRNEEDKRRYVLPFLTKRPSNWLGFVRLCNQVEGR